MANLSVVGPKSTLPQSQVEVEAPATPKEKVLITGGAGFIGSHVADRFLEAGYDVVALDNLSSGKPANLSPEVKLHVADIRDGEAVAQIIEAEQPQKIVHLAAQISVSESMKPPSGDKANPAGKEFDTDVNVGGSFNVLNGAVSAGSVNHIVAAGTGAEYGSTPEVIPTPETALTMPSSHYAASKRHMESALEIECAREGIEFLAVRPSNVYGPRQDPHGEAGVVAIWNKRFLDGEKGKIFGEGSTVRDYVYVGDLANLIYSAVENGYSGTLNGSTGKGTSTRELYSNMARVAGLEDDPMFAPDRPGDVPTSILDPAKAKQELGWEAQTPLGDGLKTTYEWFAEQHEREAAASSKRVTAQ